MKLGLDGSVTDYWADMAVRINPLPLANARMEDHEETLDTLWHFSIQAPFLTTSDRINLQDRTQQLSEDITCLNMLHDMDCEIEVLQEASIMDKEKHREIVRGFREHEHQDKQVLDSQADQLDELEDNIESLEAKIEEKDQDIVDAVMELKADITYILTEKLAGLPG